MDKVYLIVGIFCLAMFLRRQGKVRERHVGLLVRYVMTVSLPCLTLATISALDVKHAHLEIPLIAWGVMFAGTALSYGAGKALGFANGKLRAFMLATTFPNTGFLGYPLSYALFGQEGLSYAVLYDQMGMFLIFITLGFFIAGGRESLTACFRFPPFLALLAALGLSLAGLRLPGPLAVALKGIGWTTLPLTIFLIGCKIRFSAMKEIKPVAACLALRMVLVPGLCFLALYLWGKNGLPYNVTLMETAMPPALTTSILAMQYKLDEDLAVSCISAGTIICMVLFSVAMILR